MRDGNNVSRLERNIVSHVAFLQQFIEVDRNEVARWCWSFGLAARIRRARWGLFHLCSGWKSWGSGSQWLFLIASGCVWWGSLRGGRSRSWRRFDDRFRLGDWNEESRALARYDNRVARVVRDAASTRKHFEQGHVGIRLVHQGVLDSSYNGNGPAPAFLGGHLHLRVADQPVCLEHICNRLSCLHFGQARDMQPRRNQGKSDRARPTDPHFSRQFRHIKHRDTQKVAIANGVLVLR